MRATRRTTGWLLSAALLTSTFIGLSPAPASATGPNTSSILSAVNSARASAGRHSLSLWSDLSAVAYRWSQHMAATGTLAHNPGLTSQVSNWRWVGENVGYGPSVSQVHVAFMASAGHKANILDRDYTEVGVGAVWANGRLWIAEVFRQPLRATVTSSSFRNLHYGSTGTRVQRVQRRLGLRPTGWYGSVTKAKVLAFQKRHGWRGSGVVGPVTWRALGF
jgi:peptidoglycan hydrolase-like protein with peptidoglycan-binding domain